MMVDAVADAVKNGTTSEPTLKAIFLAEAINRRNGGAVIAPWKVFELDDDWLNAYRALGDAARNAKQKQRLDGYFMAARRKHPNYRKYRN
jgi:hypothetical protein